MSSTCIMRFLSLLQQSPLTASKTPPSTSRTMKPVHVQTLPVPNAQILCFAQISECQLICTQRLDSLGTSQSVLIRGGDHITG